MSEPLIFFLYISAAIAVFAGLRTYASDLKPPIQPPATTLMMAIAALWPVVLLASVTYIIAMTCDKLGNE